MQVTLPRPLRNLSVPLRLSCKPIHHSLPSVPHFQTTRSVVDKSTSSKVGHHPDWVTLTPDGKRAYVANAGSNSVSVVDIATHKELTQIPVGQVPKRNITAVLP